MLDVSVMIVEIFPRVLGLKIENPWEKGKHGLLLCTARLSRPLTSSEAKRLQASLGLDASEDLLRYACRPEEVEECRERIARALRCGTPPRASGSRRRKRPAASVAPGPRVS